jgi:hypothetical protein
MTKYSTASDQSRCGSMTTGLLDPAVTDSRCGALPHPTAASTASRHDARHAMASGRVPTVVPWSVPLRISRADRVF